MTLYQSEQAIGQLEARKGGYFFLQIEAGVVDQFPHQRRTRLVCQLDGRLSFQCGLNHLGNGHYFIILAAKNLAAIGKTLGDRVAFELSEDPNPLGVDVPEVLAALLEQDADLKSQFEVLTLGKKRSVIHQIKAIKDLDRQIEKTVALIQQAYLPRPRREK
jgi:hypothetical protein